MISRLLGKQIKNEKSVILHYWNIGSAPYHTGLDIFADDVYSVCKGVVLFVGNNGKHKSVSVQIDANQCVRYCNLLEVYVEPGQAIVLDTHVGKADKFIHFEYCTRTRPIFSHVVSNVRIGTQTYYKQNPRTFIEEQFPIEVAYPGNYTVVTDGGEYFDYKFDENQDSEFSDNRGDDYVEFEASHIY